MPDVTIVVDVLNGFCKQGNLASPRCDAAIPQIREAIEARRRAGLLRGRGFSADVSESVLGVTANHS